jgi:hypothetical protein
VIESIAQNALLLQSFGRLDVLRNQGGAFTALKNFAPFASANLITDYDGDILPDSISATGPTITARRGQVAGLEPSTTVASYSDSATTSDTPSASNNE